MNCANSAGHAREPSQPRSSNHLFGSRTFVLLMSLSRGHGWNWGSNQWAPASKAATETVKERCRWIAVVLAHLGSAVWAIDLELALDSGLDKALSTLAVNCWLASQVGLDFRIGHFGDALGLCGKLGEWPQGSGDGVQVFVP